MNYEFVDIGTSYFATSIDKFGLNSIGILVEPIKKYLDIIPNSKTIIKANYAISDSNRKGSMSVPICENKNLKYLTEEEILKISNTYDISLGGSSILNGTEVIINVPSEIIECDIITFYELCKIYEIKKINQLKIDTEGHDHIILQQVYKMVKNKKLDIDTIIFELSLISNEEELIKVTDKFLKELNYSISGEPNFWGQSDIILSKIKI